VMVKSQIDGQRQTRLVSPTTAKHFVSVLIDAGWHAYELSPSPGTP
jgi:hypothetical protein